jgi:cytochrome o ubiquinol oxidase subunit IV
MNQNHENHEWAELGSFKSYLLGFLFSLLLTVGAYFAVTKKVMFGNALVFTVAGLAVVQMVLQFIFFLHLGKEEKPRWNVMVFLFMLLIIAILVIGSLWIMYNLDYRMMPGGMND